MSSGIVRKFPWGALLCTVSFGVVAQQDAAPDDIYNLSLADLAKVEISIATGNSTPLDRAPATASVIQAAEIQAMGARTLDDVLETIPGLHVSLSSLSRLDSIYSIRGIHTGFNPHVLLLMNGVPVQSSLQGGRPTLFRLPVTSIARVEVIRGPGSAIYGADAYSGVINVITKDAAAVDATEIGMRAGEFNSRELWVQTGGRWGDVGIAFDMTYQTSDGDKGRRINRDLQTMLDESPLGTQASLAPGSLSTRYEVLDTHLALNMERWQLNLWNWHSRDAGLGAGASQSLDPAGYDNDKVWMADFTYRFNTNPEGWDNSINLSYMRYDQEVWFNIFPPNAILPIGADGNVNFGSTNFVMFPDGLIGNPSGSADESKIDWISIYNGFDSHRIRIALGARRQELTTSERKNYGPGVIDGTQPVVNGTLVDVSNTSFVFLDNSSRNINYISLQDEWRIYRDLELTAGVRYDSYSDFGGTTNPRMALVWSVNENLTTKLMYGSAFRAPSFSEQRYQNNPVSLGNPDVKPEHIDTLELSFSYRFSGDLQSTLTLFEYAAKDMIEFVPETVGSSIRRAQNARDQDGQGFEWELAWKPAPRWHFSGNYALQDARDKATDRPIADAPGQQFMFNTIWEFRPQWQIHGQVNWVADRERSASDRPAIDDYSLVNFTLRRENLLPSLDLSFSLRNILDEDAREPSGLEIPEDYPLEGRSAWLELSYTFD